MSIQSISSCSLCCFENCTDWLLGSIRREVFGETTVDHGLLVLEVLGVGVGVVGVFVVVSGALAGASLEGES